MADFRALCTELAEALDKLNCNFNVPNQSAMIERARDALAQSEPAAAADGEVAELVQWLRSLADLRRRNFALYSSASTLTRAADLLERTRGALVAAPQIEAPSWYETDAEQYAWQAGWEARDDAMLERQALRPIPVSERLPGPGDCDERGRCWWYEMRRWRLAGPMEDSEEYMNVLAACFSHWLGAHALPLPEVER